MKAALLFTHSFLLLLAFIAKLPYLALSSDDEVEPVFDSSHNPLTPGGQYWILQAKDNWGPLGGGGLKVAKTGDSTSCPVTVLQDYNEYNRGLTVKFSIPGKGPGGIIYTDTEIDIEFLEKPNCAESSKWLVFGDYDLPSPKAYVGIGGSENYPEKKTVSGKFHIQKLHPVGYKFVFRVSDSTTYWDIGKSYPLGNEGGWRLNLTHDEDPYNFIIVEANDDTVSNGIISSVV